MVSRYAAIAQDNRRRFLDKLKENGLDQGYIYLQGGVTQYAKWSDSYYPFRQEKNFYYLTGISNPDYHILINIEKEDSKLIMPTFDEHYGVWTGKVPNKEGLEKEHGIKTITIDEAKELIKNYKNSVYVFEGEEKAILGIKDLENVEEKRLLLWAIQKCRLIKHEGEMQIMRKAGVISGNAHIQLMLSLKRSPITTEKKLQVLFEYECASNGAEFQAYNPIVALGTNSTYLHYNENKSDVGSSPGEILLVDAGGEFEGYAADITRSYPVDGVFTKDAKAIYNVVLEAQEAVLAAVKPGVTWKMLQSTATNVMASKLIEIGLIKGSPDDKNVTKIVGYLLCHGIGHYIGLDVHDVGGYFETPYPDDKPAVKDSNSFISTIPANTAITVEPGLYFSQYAMSKIIGDELLSTYVDIPAMKRYASAVPGIRIEDFVIIHEDHTENLSSFVPKTVEGIENLFKGF